MKFIKWKILSITCLVCLLPIIFGLAVWNSLPDMVAVHFDFYNNPDSFTSKGFAVFGFPVLMVALQYFCCFINDLNGHKHGNCVKFEVVMKWIIPAVSIILQVLILGYALGWQVDMRVAAALVVGGMFIVIGIHLPKLDYIKNYDIVAEKARKINSFWGFETVILGILFIISIFFPPVFTLACIILLIPYMVIGVIYGIKVGRK